MFYSKKFKTFNQEQIRNILGKSNEIYKPNKRMKKYNTIYENPKFDICLLEKNPKYNWNYSKIILSPNFKPSWYHKYKDKINFTTLDYCRIYNHPNFDITWIKELDMKNLIFLRLVVQKISKKNG